MTGTGRRPHQPLAGVCDAGHARVGDHRHALARIETGQQAPDLCSLVVVVDRDEMWRVDTGVRQQLARAASVLAGDDVGVAQCLDGAGRKVAQVADRRAHEDESPLTHL